MLASKQFGCKAFFQSLILVLEGNQEDRPVYSGNQDLQHSLCCRLWARVGQFYRFKLGREFHRLEFHFWVCVYVWWWPHFLVQQKGGFHCIIFSRGQVQGSSECLHPSSLVARNSFKVLYWYFYFHDDIFWQPNWYQYLHASISAVEDQTYWDPHALHHEVGAW